MLLSFDYVQLWRHGDRSPVAVYKNDPYNSSFWVQGLGQLTPVGLAVWSVEMRQDE